ncbi:MAG TPA: phosphatase PAP2 family protein [Acidobacteriota bacterium]
MKHRFLTVFLLLLCVFGQTGAGTLWAAGDQDNVPVGQQAPAGKKPTLLHEFWQDEKEIWSSPFHLKGKQFLTLGIVLAATGLCITQDEQIAETVIKYHNRHQWLHVASKNFTQLGGFGAWAISGLFLAEGLLAKDSKAKDTGLMGLEAMLHSTVVAQFSKYVSGRQRPFVENGADNWIGLWGSGKYIGTSRSTDFTSFFSNHVAVAFSLATVIAAQYREHRWVPWVCYTLAGLEGISRLVEYRHWLSDVLIGATVGFVIGKLVVRNHRKRRMLNPTLTAGPGGLSIGLVF